MPVPKNERDSPGVVAAALAAGIARVDVSQVPFTGSTGTEVNARLKPLVAGMGGIQPSVSVASVDEQKANATATLRYGWKFPGVAQQWTYDTTAGLVDEGGQWKASWVPGLVAPGLDDSNRLSASRDQGRRGRIVGADGDAIVKLRPVVRIGIDKTRIKPDKTAAAAARLARLVDVDVKGYQKRVSGAGPSEFVEAIVLRAEADERPSNRSVYAVDGAIVLSGDAMLSPSRSFARQILGTVGTASKEIVDTSEGRVTGADQVGRSGLQRRYDEQLRGTPGVAVRLVAAPTQAGPSGTSASPTPGPSGGPSSSATPAPARTVFSVKPVAGSDLDVTLSIPLQTLAERVLAKTKPAAALVVIRPSTGRVLAAANGPGSQDQSVAMVGRFAPGSTFKVATSLALLRAGLKPSSRVSCPRTVTVNGKKFKNYSDYPTSSLGDVSLRTALAQSCNTALIGQRARISATGLAEAAASLGLGVDYDVGYPSFFGSVPPDPTATGRAAALIGQGKVQASPLSMAAVVASVAAGRTVLPTLVTKAEQPASKAKPLTPAESATLQEMMAAVVSEGSGRVLRGLPGPRVLAKTGTAEYGARPPFKTHAWMVAAQGDLAVAVFVGTGSSGSRTAGPLLRQFLSQAR
ncbi:MAG TPA: penicillin-binding transpeptidase domain-containing protein [Propionibacteriaceae bacterium]